jgi:hypothetical protein
MIQESTGTLLPLMTKKNYYRNRKKNFKIALMKHPVAAEHRNGNDEKPSVFKSVFTKFK